MQRILIQGNEAKIQACQEDDANCLDHVMSKIEYDLPQALILGGVSCPADMDYYVFGPLMYYNSPMPESLALVKDQTVIARKKFVTFFEKQLAVAPHLLLEDPSTEEMSMFVSTKRTFDNQKSVDDYRIFEDDPVEKRKIWRMQLTAARLICTFYDRNLFFGKVDPLLAMEHIAATRSLEDLRMQFDKALDEFRLRANEEDWNAVYTEEDLGKRLKEIAAEIFEEGIYREQVEFSGSITRRCAKIFNKGVTTLVDPPTMTQAVATQALNKEVREIDEIYTRQFDHLSGSYRQLEDLLEKMAILQHLFSDQFAKYVRFGHAKDMLDHFWHGIFTEHNDLTNEQIVAIYKKVSKKYHERVRTTFLNDLERLQELAPSGRLYVELYSEVQKRIDKKVQRQYRFVTNPKKELMMHDQALNQLILQIMHNIDDRERRGVDQSQTKNFLTKLAIGYQKEDQKGNFVPAGAFKILRELFVEANSQLKLFRLPEDVYGKYESLIRITMYDQMKKTNFGGEDPRLAIKKERALAETQAETGVYLQMQDGQVPSFQKFKAIKDKIQKGNKLEGAMTPLAMKERQEVTLEQYMKLNEMINEKNEKRVRAL